MRTILFVIFSFLALTIFAGNEPVDKTRQAKEWLNNQPLAFTENKGQFTNSDGKPANNVLFKASYGDCDIYITTEGISYVFHKYEQNPTKSIDTNTFRRMPGEKTLENKSVSYYRLDMNLQGSAINKTQILKELPGKQGVTNYFYPHCPDGIYGVQEYGKIIIKNIYKGIDWVIYTNAENKEAPLKYDFVVQPQANYKDIKIKFVNAQNTSLADNGTKLKIQTIAGNIEEGNLYSYLQNSTDKQAIKTNYIANSDSTYEFELGAYDKTKTLVIDPLVWATYYGASQTDEFYSICVDRQDNIYITGVTGSIDFPTQLFTGAYNESTNTGSADLVILKFNSAGICQWATYYGGSINEYGQSICIDSQNNIYITGETNSPDFPLKHLPGAYNQSANQGLSDAYADDAYILKFNDKGERLWSTFYGGDDIDNGFSIIADGKDNIYLSGSTTSKNLPLQVLPGGYSDASYAGNNLADIFILKFNTLGEMKWSTYYGGSGFDHGYSICTDSQENIYISGETTSPDFPTKPQSGAYNQSTTVGYNDLFLLKFNNQGILQWSTCYGGSGFDYNRAQFSSNFGHTLAADSQDNIYLTGATESKDFPIQTFAGAYNQSAINGIYYYLLNAFIVKFDKMGVLKWSTYYGGNSNNGGASIGIDKKDNVYITGNDLSANLPTKQLAGEYWQPMRKAATFDAFITMFNNQGVLLWGTYYGSGDWTIGTDIAVDSKNSVYFIGSTFGADLYTKDYGDGAYYDDSWNVMTDSYILKTEICTNLKPSSIVTNRNNICSIELGNITLTAIGGEGKTLKWYSNNLGLNYIGKDTPLIIQSPTKTTTYYARWESLCDTSECDSVKVIIIPKISINRDHSICSGETYTVGISNYTTAGIYTDILKSISGCDSTVITNLVVNPTILNPITRKICQGETFFVGTKGYIATGIYSDTLSSVLFCDSIVTTNLTVNPAYQITPSPFICPGETVAVGTHTYSASGTYVDKLSTTDGCDSIITTNLTVYPVEQNIQFPNKCTGESITVGLNTYTETGTYTDVLTSSHNCDSTVITHLTINPAVLNPITESICEGETFTVGTNVYSSPGIYIDVLKTTLGCDSTVTTTLTVNPVPYVSLGNDQLLCPGDSITLTPGIGFISYLWSDGSLLSNLIVNSPGKYSVTAFNEWCPASDEISIHECGTQLWFPNAFSPNGDYTNESFNPVILGTLITYQILIYNRWGQQVYESNNVKTGWDGSFKGNPCAIGQYVYIATYSMGNELSTQKHGTQRGTVTLLR